MYARFLPILQSKQDKIAKLEKRTQKRQGTSDMEVEEDENDDSYGSGTDIDDENESGRGEKSKKASVNNSMKFDKSINDSQDFLGIS